MQNAESTTVLFLVHRLNEPDQTFVHFLKPLLDNFSVVNFLKFVF